MLQVFLFVMAVLLANVGVYAGCEPFNPNLILSTRTSGKCNNYQGGGTCGQTCTEVCASVGSVGDRWINHGGNYYFRNCVERVRESELYRCNFSDPYGGCTVVAIDLFCSEKCDEIPPSSSSAASSSSSPPGPPLGGGCGFCQDTVDYSEFPPQVKHVVWHCDSCTAGRDGIANEAAGCSIESIGLGSCEDNNECPSGVICMDDSTFNYDCYATVGATVYVRNRKNGNVFSCEADGSCDMALKKVASGECRDPSQPPDANNSSSSGSGDSSSSGEPNPESSSDETCDLCDKLGKIVANTQVTAENTGDIANYTQETMNKAIDIYNQQTEMQIDLSHVRSNTENTATNTGNIDTKLSTTNNLLNDIKNKNWSPQIHVGSPDVNVEVQGDTNIVTVTADTSRSPFEILQFLKEIFSGDTSSGINPSDTVGTADSVNSLLSALFGDSLNQYNGDSLATARDGYGAAFRAYKDTLNGIMRDSLNAWNNTLLNNGVLSGDGSNDCPAFLTSTRSLAFGSLFTVQLPAIGGVLCNPIPHTSISFWGLARTLLRMLVAIACMWWIYHAVIGSRGNDED